MAPYTPSDLGIRQGRSGSLQDGPPITATGAQSGNFRWSCEKTDIAGSLLLAPTKVTAIQALQLRVTPKQ